MSSSNAPRGKRAAGPVGQFFKKKPVRIALRAIGGVFKCILTILLIGVITASIVGCVMVVYVVTSFNGSEGIPDLKNISLNETPRKPTRRLRRKALLTQASAKNSRSFRAELTPRS